MEYVTIVVNLVITLRFYCIMYENLIKQSFNSILPLGSIDSRYDRDCNAIVTHNIVIAAIKSIMICVHKMI